MIISFFIESEKEQVVRMCLRRTQFVIVELFNTKERQIKHVIKTVHAPPDMFQSDISL